MKEFYPENIADTITLKARAKRLRSNQTYCEKIIWNAVRDNRLGVKFRRQFIISYYIVDFICLEKKLIIEIDGVSHIGQEDEDKIRENNLLNNGYNILRFTDDEVSGGGDKVIEKIIEKLNEL